MLDLSQGHDVGVAEVVQHFLSLEVPDAGFGRDKAELHDRIRQLADGGQVDATSVLREFLVAKNDEGNPVGTWILHRSHRIRRWLFFERLPLESLYTSGVSKYVNDALCELGWSLVAFAPYAQAYPQEFKRLDEVPEGEHRTLIVVVPTVDAQRNRAELIDGFHRAISMLRNGEKVTAAFVAEVD